MIIRVVFVIALIVQELCFLISSKVREVYDFQYIRFGYQRRGVFGQKKNRGGVGLCGEKMVVRKVRARCFRYALYGLSTFNYIRKYL